MVLTSPRLATLNRLYQGAMTARACASVRPWAEAAETPVSNAAARENSISFVMAFPSCMGARLRARQPAIYGTAFQSDRRWMSKIAPGGSAENTAEKDALELRDGRGVTLALRKKDRSLQRGQDEVT